MGRPEAVRVRSGSLIASRCRPRGRTRTESASAALPALPESNGVDAARLRGYPNDVVNAADPFSGATDTGCSGPRIRRPCRTPTRGASEGVLRIARAPGGAAPPSRTAPVARPAVPPSARRGPPRRPGRSPPPGQRQYRRAFAVLEGPSPLHHETEDRLPAAHQGVGNPDIRQRSHHLHRVRGTARPPSGLQGAPCREHRVPSPVRDSAIRLGAGVPHAPKALAGPGRFLPVHHRDLGRTGPGLLARGHAAGPEGDHRPGPAPLRRALCGASVPVREAARLRDRRSRARAGAESRTRSPGRCAGRRPDIPPGSGRRPACSGGRASAARRLRTLRVAGSGKADSRGTRSRRTGPSRNGVGPDTSRRRPSVEERSPKTTGSSNASTGPATEARAVTRPRSRVGSGSSRASSRGRPRRLPAGSAPS